MLEAKLQVDPVLVGEGWNGKRDPGKVDALVLSKLAAVDDFTFNVCVAGSKDAQLDQTVGEQNACAGFDFPRQPLKCG
jgi:hypothetical protein